MSLERSRHNAQWLSWGKKGGPKEKPWHQGGVTLNQKSSKMLVPKLIQSRTQMRGRPLVTAQIGHGDMGTHHGLAPSSESRHLTLLVNPVNLSLEISGKAWFETPILLIIKEKAFTD